MYKNQLQELAQRSCFNLPSYACIREGPDHAPRFKASVNFNGEVFEAPNYCTTLRQAEHAAAEVALNTLSTRGPSRSLTARVLDETGVYKNLLQETAHRAGLNLPIYTTVRSGPGHLPVFTSIVELAGMNFNGEPARTKKQAEKNAAMAAWSALKQMSNVGSFSSQKEIESSEEQEHVIVARVLSKFRPKDENKSARQKDQNQVRKRLVLGGYNKNKTTLQYQHWRSVGMLSEFSSSIPSQRQNHQHSLLSSLPPPSSYSITSKILPPQPPNSSANKTIQSIYSLEELHKKDEEEWLNGKSEIKEMPKEKKDPNNANLVFQPKLLPQRPLTIPNQPYGPPPSVATISTTPRILTSGGFHPHNIAPAVQIRSVIPVCATPPPMNLPLPKSSPIVVPPKKEQEEEEKEEEVTKASSKANKFC